MIVFGGCDAYASCFNEVWSLDGSGFLTTTGTPPSSRYGATAVWDPAAKRMILFGGSNGSAVYGDTWVLSFATQPPTWSQLSYGVCETRPPTPVLAAPAPAANTSCGPTFSWSVPGQIQGYSFSLVLNGQTVATDLATTSYTLPPEMALSASANTWQVEAVGCPGATGTSAPSSFDVTTIGAPSLVSPSNLASGYCSQTFQWAAPSGAIASTTYDLLLGKTLPLSPVATNISATSLTLSGHELLTDGTYLWTVQAHDCTGTGPAAGTRQITVSNKPPTPVLATPPSNGAVNATPHLSWTAAGAHADVTYAVTIDGRSVVDGLSSTAWDVPATLGLVEGLHTWSVTATGCLGSTASSGTRTFKVDATAPSAFDLQSPPDGTWFHEGSVPLSWSSSTDRGGVSYEPQVTGPGSVVLPSVTGTTTAWGIGSEVMSTDFSAPWQLQSWTVENAWTLGAWDGRSALVSNTGNYANVRNDSAALTSPFVAAADTVVSYWVGYDLETNYDFAYLEISAAGAPWTPIATYTGSNPAGRQEEKSLGAYAGQSVALRFRIQTDTANTPQPNWRGIAVDDFRIGNGVAEGIYNWTVVATDGVGNRTAALSTWRVGIDQTPPGPVTGLSPSGVISGAVPMATWSPAVDSLSGVCSYTVILDDTLVVSGTIDTHYLLPTPISSGSHTWSVRANDCAGNAGPVVSASFRVPPNPPSIASPAEGQWLTEARPVVTWTDRDPAAASYLVTVDAWPPTTVNASMTAFTVPTDLSAGPHCVQVAAVDAYSNIGPATTRCFGIDLAPPAAPLLLAPENGAFSSGEGVVLRWAEAADDSSGPCGYIPIVDGASLPEQPQTSVSVQGPLAEGGHLWTVQAVDCAGHTGVVARQRSFFVDTTAPDSVVLLSPSPGAWVGESPPTLSWMEATDNGSGLCGYTVKLDAVEYPIPQSATSFVVSSPLTEGPHSWSVTAVDCVGNRSEATTPAPQFFVDRTAPSAVVITVPASGGWVRDTLPFIAWESPVEEASGLAAYLVETEAGITSVEPGTRTYVPSAPLGEGEYCVTIKAKDNAGNVSVGTQVCFQVDLTGPSSPEPIDPSAGRVLGEPFPVFSWSPAVDAGAGVCGYDLAIDLEPPVHVAGTTAQPSVALAEGLHRWKVRATDCVGNTGDYSQFVVFGVDLTPPGPVAIVIPSEGEWVGSRRPTLTWSEALETGSGLSAYFLSIDEGPSARVPPDQTSSGPQQDLDEGQHCAAVHAVDNAGLEGTADTRCFNVDVTPPAEPVLVSPQPGACLPRMPTVLRWSPSDDTLSGLASYSVELDLNPLASQLPSTTTSVDVAPELSPGAHTWRVDAQDQVGNQTSSVTGAFGVDDTPPTCSITAIVEAGDAFEIRGTASDSGCGGVATVEILIDEQPSVASVGNNGDWIGAWAPEKSGISRIACRVTDGAGLQFTSRTFVIERGPCLQLGPCDASTGSCASPKTDGSCDDGNSCTVDDHCNENGLCVGQPSAAQDCAPNQDAGTPGEVDGGTTSVPSVVGCRCSGGSGVGTYGILLIGFLRRRKVRRPS